MRKLWSEEYLHKVIPRDQIHEKVTQLKNEKKTIATLNGSFDLLHAGHLQIIYEASEQADILIVALNTDESIQRYKSIDRPIIPLIYRMQMLCALEFVDYVTSFNETNPCLLLNEIQPSIHVNGVEYGPNCIEADIVRKNGGHIHLVELIPGLSTSQIIKKIAVIESKGV